MTLHRVRSFVRFLGVLALGSALAGAFPGTLAGQTGTGKIEGHVRDTTQHPIPSATVFIVGTQFSGTTDSSGFYVIRNTPVGVVTVRAAYPGYKAGQVTGLRIRPDTVTTLDFALVPQAQNVSEITVKEARANPIVPRDQSITTGASMAGGRGGGRGGVAIPTRAAAGQFGCRSPQDCGNTESYDRIVDNPFLAPSFNPLSTFSIDVDRASYSNVRRFIEQRQQPPKDAVRIEELINYFPYDYPAPTDGTKYPFTVTTEVSDAPWNPAHRLVRIGLQGRKIETAKLPPNNLVFLIDVSGSMSSPNKLPLVKASLHLLVDQLREQDRVALAVYAGSAGLVLPSTSGEEKGKIMEAIDRLSAGGSTAGGAGLRLAYSVARENFITGGNNRVILSTDGDFNVGLSSDAEMERLIEDERDHGVSLTVLGFGMGNYKDSKMEKLADKGNGNYAYIDGIMEARKTLVHEMGATLLTIAKDVKLQVEFNPARVQGYRLIGYENRMLRSEDFTDDRKDAGDMGAGHSVTALYEVIPAGQKDATPIRGVDSLRYQSPPKPVSGSHGDELLFVKLRYKEPGSDTSTEFSHLVPNQVRAPSTDFAFAQAVAEFGMLLRDSEYKGNATVEDVIARARRSLGADREGYRAAFVELAQAWQRIPRPREGQ